MINFNVPTYVGNELKYMQEAILQHKICGDGYFTKNCSHWLENRTKSPKVLLTTSCTHAIEMAAILLNIQKGDEVIMPAYTFVSTANAFVMRGATIVFVDIRPDTMNINEKLIEMAITKNTKAIVPVHYAGVACEMDGIMDVAKKYNLAVVEDAAQGVMSFYNGKALGTIGNFGCYSFHETKNYSMGEGGALLIRDENYVSEAEVIREKGTNRSQFFRGQIDKYTWIKAGSSYLPSDLNAAYLWAQLEIAEQINVKRLQLWNRYYELLSPLQERIQLPVIPYNCTHNAHMFYIKTRNLAERTELINYLNKCEIMSVFHYIPLHTAPAGRKFGRFAGVDRYTTLESERLLRLPLYYELRMEQVDFIAESIKQFYSNEKKYM